MKRMTSLLLILFFQGLAACATVTGDAREPASSLTKNAAWEDYEKSYAGQSLQASCGPRQVLPPQGTEIRGKVIALHGYTACPQQFFEWSKRLAADGYVVQMMLLPGHGLTKLPNGADNIDQMPGHARADAYYAFADQVVKIARADRLPTILTGLSVGGAIAMQAGLKDPGAFEKIILFSPLFAASDVFQRNFIPVGGIIPILDSKIISWGPSCLNEMSRGRAGYCTFRIHQVGAAQKFGEALVEKATPIYPKLQIVGVAGDKAASTEYIYKVAKNLGWSLQKHDDVSVCLYKGGANHSLLSRFDSPDENKFWLPSLLKDATAFVENATFVPVQGDSGEFGIPACVVNPKIK